MDGIFNLWKPIGMTSHDVVATVRRLTGERRVGHAGSLDPLAEGVLVVGVGQGTRVLEYVLEGTKEYCARIHLGIRTDTDDAEGKVTSVTDVKAFRRRTIEGVLRSFVGRGEQTPPVYSAIKQHGQAMYRLARAGVDVTPQSRPVDIHGIDLIRWQRPHIVCRVVCSKGTYIRSLARDVGERLGCGAHLCGLVRRRSGAFTAEEAVPLSLLAHALTEGYWQHLIYPVDAAVEDRPAVIVGTDDEIKLRQGRCVDWGLPEEHTAHTRQPWRAYSSDGRLIALLMCPAGARGWQPHKVFPVVSPNDGPSV